MEGEAANDSLNTLFSMANIPGRPEAIEVDTLTVSGRLILWGGSTV
jgi:hypothetical protein